TQLSKVIEMSLGEEMFEWRKQMVEKLLLQESNIDQLEEKVDRAEKILFGDCTAAFKIECTLRNAYALKAILDDFATKNNCKVSIVECE
ncbi:hypothetical protein ACL0WX_003898, partial [Acinetobacter baumannii]